VQFGIWQTVLFNLFILAMLALDLGVLNRRARAMSSRGALLWTCIWVSMAFAFGGGLFWKCGSRVGQEFIAGYLIEWSLSVDNIFVFVLIFSFFKVARHYQHRVLFWGILSALVLRGFMILAGAALIHRFGWIIFVFGLFLIVTGIRMGLHKESSLDPGDTWVVRLARRLLPVTDGYRDHHFVVREAGHWAVTPLFLVLLVIETTDVVFALDSIPAIFAVTRDPFIVYTSNVFAILGLRSLYFLLANVMDMFRYLKFGISVVLVFVGIKMLLSESRWALSTPVALGVIAAVLGMSVALSILATRIEDKRARLKSSETEE
jgi:tellurite resistance protein TerC